MSKHAERLGSIVYHEAATKPEIKMYCVED